MDISRLYFCTIVHNSLCLRPKSNIGCVIYNCNSTDEFNTAINQLAESTVHDDGSVVVFAYQELINIELSMSFGSFVRVTAQKESICNKLSLLDPHTFQHVLDNKPQPLSSLHPYACVSVCCLVRTLSPHRTVTACANTVRL